MLRRSLSLTLLLVLGSCAGGPAGVVLGGRAGAAATAAEERPETPGAVSPPASVPDSGAERPVSLRLPRFYQRLAQLSAAPLPEQRTDHVRIAWFGDSHTAADFLTGALRRHLQASFGNGGPGFVAVGTGLGRHEEVSSERNTKWRRLPASPASHRVQLDGVYGLHGTRAVAEAYTASARLKLRQQPPKCPTGASRIWELVFRPLTAELTWSAKLGEESMALRLHAGRWSAEGSAVRVRGSQLHGWVLRGASAAELRIAPPSSNVEVFGAFVECDARGVVLDALGINGARIRTVTGWHEGTWLGELAERDPALVVLAYGTNELGDRAPPETYRPYYQDVLRKAALAAPDADCLLVGPTDRRGEDGHSLTRVKELDDFQRGLALEFGCAYFSLFEAMGGEGGYERWARRSPSWAGQDGVHLTVLGYQELAEALWRELAASFIATTGMAIVE